MGIRCGRGRSSKSYSLSLPSLLPSPPSLHVYPLPSLSPSLPLSPLPPLSLQYISVEARKNTFYILSAPPSRSHLGPSHSTSTPVLELPTQPSVLHALAIPAPTHLIWSNIILFSLCPPPQHSIQTPVSRLTPILHGDIPPAVTRFSRSTETLVCNH